MSDSTAIPLPRCWPGRVKAAILQTISLAHLAICHARGWSANALNPRARQAAKVERLTAEVALLREELAIKDARLAPILPNHRPHYTPTERMRILELKAARGSSIAQVAKAFLLDAQTPAAWLRRVDQDGPDALNVARLCRWVLGASALCICTRRESVARFPAGPVDPGPLGHAQTVRQPSLP